MPTIAVVAVVIVAKMIVDVYIQQYVYTQQSYFTYLLIRLLWLGMVGTSVVMWYYYQKGANLLRICCLYIYASGVCMRESSLFS